MESQKSKRRFTKASLQESRLNLGVNLIGLRIGKSLFLDMCLMTGIGVSKQWERPTLNVTRHHPSRWGPRWNRKEEGGSTPLLSPFMKIPYGVDTFSVSTTPWTLDSRFFGLQTFGFLALCQHPSSHLLVLRVASLASLVIKFLALQLIASHCGTVQSP